jgi:hypothetical protein
MELSVVYSCKSAPRLRALFEPQGDPASPSAYWNAGARFTRFLNQQWNAPIDHFLRLEDIFVPDASDPHLCMGHAVEFGEQPSFKMYFNAMTKGPRNTAKCVDEAFSRMGYSRPWNKLKEALGPSDRIELFAFDLAPAPRLKLYVRPMSASLEHIARLYSVSAASDPNDVRMMWENIRSPLTPPESSRPVILTYHFGDPLDERPSRTALCIPLFPDASSDLAAEEKIRRLLHALAIPVEPYTACLRAMADGPLAQEEGIHSYIGLHRSPEDVAVAAYFNPRLYFRRYGWLGRNPTRTWPTAAAS